MTDTMMNLWEQFSTIYVRNIKLIQYTTLEKMAKNYADHSKIQNRDFWMIRIFPGKNAVYVSYSYSEERSCKKAKKSLARFSRFFAD